MMSLSFSFNLNQRSAQFNDVGFPSKTLSSWMRDCHCRSFNFSLPCFSQNFALESKANLRMVCVDYAAFSPLSSENWLRKGRVGPRLEPSRTTTQVRLEPSRHASLHKYPLGRITWSLKKETTPILQKWRSLWKIKNVRHFWFDIFWRLLKLS